MEDKQRLCSRSCPDILGGTAPVSSWSHSYLKTLTCGGSGRSMYVHNSGRLVSEHVRNQISADAHWKPM